jgi:hypothetical protein
MKAEAPRTPKYSRLTRRVFTSTGGLPSTLTLCLSNALCPASVAEKDWVRPRRASNSRVERLLRSPVDVPDADASEGRVGERNQLLKIFDRQQLEEDGADQAEDGCWRPIPRASEITATMVNQTSWPACGRQRARPAEMFKARHTHILEVTGWSG